MLYPVRKLRISERSDKSGGEYYEEKNGSNLNGSSNDNGNDGSLRLHH